MNKGKKLVSDSASIFDLKAELFKKQEAYKHSNTQRKTDTFVKGPLNKKILSANVPVKKPRNQPSIESPTLEVDHEIEMALKKSQESLKRKAEIYDKLSKKGTDLVDEEDETYLVNFNKKLVETKRQCLEEDWVEYEDSFGRSRKCLRKDLPNLIDLDKDIEGSSSSNTNEFAPPQSYDNNQYQYNANPVEPEEEAKDIHFQNVLHKEIRDYGVGYYAFSEDEITRKSQMDRLNKMREDTLKNRVSSAKLKKKKKEILEAKLRKIKERKNINVDVKDFISSDEEEPTPEKKNDATPVEPESETRKVPTKIRPWDKGKIGVPKRSINKEWLEKQRDDRNPEFAPPPIYLKTPSNIDDFLNSFRK